jgi:hypothetical protein
MVRRRAAHGLIEQVVRGAVEADAVRLHGAIVATFELFPPHVAADTVFTPALATLDGASDAHRMAAAAIDRHRPLYAG